MASPEAIALSAKVEERMKLQQIIEYTNDDNDATTINYIRFYACCDDAIGKFRIQAKTEPDMENATHIHILSSGVLYLLALYSGRDSALLKTWSGFFFGGMKDLAMKHYPLAISNSKLQQSQELSGVLPDMDRRRRVFLTGRGGANYPSETTGDIYG